ncbi:ATP/GTP-binding site motif A [mine drainage metagenome]|uniref:ATP/GTP-binding site motif A n=1 Tax=mine drainage metagenome TaxID=410659 RepID=T1CI37_9ZZZZ
MKINMGEGIDLDAQLVMTGRCCVIGQSGSGKSFLIGVIAEELCKLGLPFLIVDTEGEYHNLKSAFKAIWVSNSQESDIGMDVDYTKLLAESINGNVPIVFDVSDVVDQSGYVYSMLGALYNLEDKMHVPYLVIIEEADKLAPQVLHSGKNMVEEISVRGRKRGIGLLIATQRPANISKNVLSQCSYGFVGKLTIENDISAIDILFNNRQLRDSIVHLSQGEFVPFGIGIDRVVKVKGRSLSHYGSTPKVVAGSFTADLSAIIGRVSSGTYGKGKIADIQAMPKPRAASKSEVPKTISIIKPNFSEDDALAYANRKASRRVVPIIGKRNAEVVESIDTFYYPLRHFRILVPRRNTHEFIERFALVDAEARIANLNNGLKFVKQGIRANAHNISNSQERLLEQLRVAGKSNIEKLEKHSGTKRLGSEIKSLVGLGAVRLSGKYYMLNDGLKLASKQDFKAIEVEGIEPKEIAVMNGASMDSAAKLIFPGCRIYNLGVLYLKMYKITLRRGDRVRVFIIDSISFKDRPELVSKEISDAGTGKSRSKK